MKAYYIDIKDDPDQGGYLVWDTTVRKAKKRVDESDLQYESWLDVQCHRMKRYDGMEGLSDSQLALVQWHDGWWWDNAPPTDDGDTSDEEFLKWWHDNFDKTCEDCKKIDETVRLRACVYQEDVNGKTVFETVCDDCEHAHLMDI